MGFPINPIVVSHFMEDFETKANNSDTQPTMDVA